MILTTIKIHGRAEKRTEIVQTIRGLSEQLIEREGCLKADLYQDLDDKNIFYLLEVWPTRKHLESHMTSKSQAVLLGLETVLAKSLEIYHAVKF